MHKKQNAYALHFAAEFFRWGQTEEAVAATEAVRATPSQSGKGTRAFTIHMSSSCKQLRSSL